MVGVVLATSSQVQDTAITDALAGVQTVVTNSSDELLEQVEKLRPDVLLLDAFHASDKELLAAFRAIAPWGYVVLICQQPSDLRSAAGLDEVWPISIVSIDSVRFLLRLARLNRYRLEHITKCELCEGIGYNVEDSFFVDKLRFVSPGAWALRCFQEWDFLLQCVSTATAITSWPGELPLKVTGLTEEHRSVFSDKGFRLDSLFDTGGHVLSISFEGAYFPVAAVWEHKSQPQMVAETAASQLPAFYRVSREPQVRKLLNDVLSQLLTTLNQQYLLALYSLGQCVFCRSVITDMTFYDGVSAALDGGLVLLDAEHNLVYANQRAIGLLAGDTAEGREVSRSLLKQILNRVPSEKEQCRLILTASSPEGRRLVVRVAPAVATGGELLGYAVALQEETKAQELQMVDDSHRQRLAAIGELAAGMAHEIRNPLTSIRGFIQLLKQRLVNTKMEVEMRYVDYVLEEIDRVNHVVTNFLNLAKPQEEDWREVDVNELLTKILQLVENQAMLKGVYLTWQFAPNLARVRGKAESLVQVFLNIINNALQATSKGCSIHIFTRQAEDSVLVSVQDTGTGMSPAVLKRIFKPFYSTKEGGTGLGLALCKQIVEEHHGEIQVTSQVGEGSCFTVRLPIA